jgi:hypothetical protein
MLPPAVAAAPVEAKYQRKRTFVELVASAAVQTSEPDVFAVAIITVGVQPRA